MSSNNSPCNCHSHSPLASTEERSIHDNISVNKLNLEKGLKNRPKKCVLVDKGILLNSGKAYSDKMHQLDRAKKRDRLKKKMENRPHREELIRKLILHEESHNRIDELNRIKQLLDCSINSRPGSLELVDKNILQVDRLLASKVHNGDIIYPKVNAESDSPQLNPRLSISEDSPDLPQQHANKPSSNKSPQISYKKTCRVGRFSFHNIEFRPAAQKAREYQQNELLEYEKIQAQHDPSLKKVHKELTMKSCDVDDGKLNLDKSRTPKYSLLYRLNVYELKSECKLRHIPCSNVPKAQLVEKLLPFESEILEPHTPFSNTTHSPMTNVAYNYPMSTSQSVFEFPATESNMLITTNLPPSLNLEQNRNLSSDPQIINKMYHSFSESIIPDYTHMPHGSYPLRSGFVDSCHTDMYPKFQDYQHLSPSYSYPLINDCSPCVNQSCHSPFPNGLTQGGRSQSQGLNRYQSLPTNATTPILIREDPLPMFTVKKPFTVDLPFRWNIKVHPVPAYCYEKFWLISEHIYLLQNSIEKMNFAKIHNSNPQIIQSILEEYESLRFRLIDVCNGMVDFINVEQNLGRLDCIDAMKQKNWITNLLDSIKDNFEETLYDGPQNIRSDGFVNDNNLEASKEYADLDDLDICDFFNMEHNNISWQTNDIDGSLGVENTDHGWRNGDSNLKTDINTPKTDFQDNCISPMSIGDVDHIMKALLNSSADHSISPL